MNISQNVCGGNSGKLFATQETTQSQYLTPDYFLPASQSDSYYSRKYSRSISRISRIVSASLLSTILLTATLDAKAQPSVKSKEFTVQLPNTEPNGNNSDTSRWFKFKSPLSHLSNILGFNSSSTASKAQEKPITIEELQDLYNNDPEEQAGNNFNNINTSFNFGADGSDTLSRDSIYFRPQDSLIKKDWDEETIYSEPWDDTVIQDSYPNTNDQDLPNASASSYIVLSPSAPLAEGLPSAPPLEYLASAPSDKDLPLPSAPPAEGITEIEKEAIEILDRVLDGDSAYETLSDDTISDTSSEHSLEQGFSIPTTPTISSPSNQHQGMKAEIGGVNITIPNHFFAQDTEDTSSLSNFSENDDEWDEDALGNEYSEQANTANTEPVNTSNGSESTKSSTSVPTQDLPKIVGYEYKEPLIPNNHYKAKPSSAEILEELAVKDEMHKTLSRRRAATEIEEDDEVEGLDEGNEVSSPEAALQSAPPADATYSKLSASEEAKQTIARNKSAIAENRALLETKYDTIAKSRLGQVLQDPDTEIGNAFTSEFESKNNEQTINNDDAEDLPLPPPPSEEELALMDMGIISDANDINTTQIIDYDVLAQEQARLPLPPYPVTEVGREHNISEIKESVEEDLPFPPHPSEEELAELTKESGLDTLTQSNLIAVELVGTEEQQADASGANYANINSSNQEVSEDEEDTSNSFDTDETDMRTALTDSMNGSEQQISNISQAELLKKAATTAACHAQAREASKIASKQIRHRIFAREAVTAAVAAGDEDADEALDDAAEQTRSYSIWSSGTLGSNKQKAKADLNGYSTKIAGGTIGLELNLENDQLLGSSFSKFTSRVKYQDQGGSNDLQNSSTSTSTKYATHIFSLYGSRPVSRNMNISLIGSAGYSKSKKANSTLFSLEPSLNYKLKLPRAVTLIPLIGFRYEYEKANAYQEQIASSLSIERGKQSYQQFSTEIGSRVIFAPIKLKSSIPSSISITPTAHFSLERRIGSRGKSNPSTLTYYESQQTIGTGMISTNAQNDRTSLNAGVGLIASHKNIKLELLYDQQRQKRFKSHQGVLKLKVSL